MIWSVLLVVSSGFSFAQAAKPHLPSAQEAARATEPQSLATLSPEQYRDRLVALQKLVTGCRSAISASHCPTDAVGADVQVSFSAGPRTVRFGWLKTLMEDAAKADPAKSAPETPKNSQTKAVGGKVPPLKAPVKDSPADEPGNVPATAQRDERDAADAPSSLTTRLDQAGERLAQDLNSIASATDAKQVSPASTASRRQALTDILSAKEYRAATVGRTLKDRILEKIAQWINTAIEKLVNVGSKSKWIGVTAEIVFVIVLCVALVWFLIRLEKQGRFGSAMFQAAASNGAPSERDWQLWLKDARDAATSGAWREAIHYLYWSSISRLESGGQWRPDRARTPREYLALLSAATPQRAELKSGLTALTRSFERTWYGGRPAAQADYHHAEQLAAALGANPEGAPDARGGSR